MANAWFFQNFPDTEEEWYSLQYDFDNENDVDAFTGTALASGTGAVTLDKKFGWYRMSGNATSDNSGYQLQGDMETISLNAGKQVLFESKFIVSDATQSEVFAGIAITDTTVLDAGGLLVAADVTASDAIGLYKPDGETNIYGVVNRDSVMLATGALGVAADATDVRVGFRVIMDPNTAGKGKVLFYVNGQLGGSLDSTTMPYDTEEILTPTIAFNTGDALGTKTCDWDYVRVAQSR